MLELESERYLDEQTAKLAPVEIDCPMEGLSEGDRLALPRLIRAAAVMDGLFLKQVYSRNENLLIQLERGKSDLEKKALEFFRINFGPFDRLNNHHPFIGRSVNRRVPTSTPRI